MPLRKTHGSVSSNDSGHSDAMSFCEPPNVYHLTSSILHNVPNAAVPLPPRRHSAVQQGSTSNYSQQMIPPTSSSTKQANGDISSMPPPPIPRSRPVPYPVAVPVIPSGSNVNVPGYNMFPTQQQQQQFQQMRHAGKINIK
jgi:hypothetical protein